MSHPQFDAYRIKLFYTWEGLEHVFQTWAVPQDFGEAPGQDLDQYGVTRRGGTFQNADAATDDLLTAVVGLFHTDTDFTRVELWKHEAGESEGFFLTAAPSVVTGSSTTANVTAAQLILTSRTNLGHIKKFYFEENNSQSALPQGWVAGVSGVLGGLGTYVLGDGSWMRDRYGGYPIALMNILKGQSEATFKHRLRP